MAALAAKAVKDQRRKAAQLKLADNMTDQKQNRKQSLTSVTTMGSFDPEVWHHIADYLYSMIAAACYSQKKKTKKLDNSAGNRKKTKNVLSGGVAKRNSKRKFKHISTIET